MLIPLQNTNDAGHVNPGAWHMRWASLKELTFTSERRSTPVHVVRIDFRITHGLLGGCVWYTTSSLQLGV